MDVYTKFTRHLQDKLYVYIHTVFQKSIAPEQCHAFAWFGKIYTHDFQNACAAEFSSTPIVLSYINLDKITSGGYIISFFKRTFNLLSLLVRSICTTESYKAKPPILKSCWHSSSCTHKVRLIFFIKKMRG